MSQFKTMDDAISYSKEKVKTFRDSLEEIEIWCVKGGFDVVHNYNSNGRNWCIANKGTKVATISKEVKQ